MKSRISGALVERGGGKVGVGVVTDMHGTPARGEVLT